MAKIFSLENCGQALRSAIQSTIRGTDEAVVLPSASRSLENGAFKNIIFKLSADDATPLDEAIFSEGFFNGISVVKIPTSIAEALLNDPVRRDEALHKLALAIPSEMTNSSISVGPALDGDNEDRDTESWTCGFSTPSDCVGLYAAQHSKPVMATLEGMSRVHNQFFLVVKAGGGVASQTFHARLSASLRKGKTLNAALEENASGLRRVTTAGKRNRARILVLAAKTLGFTCVDTIGDSAASDAQSHEREAIPLVDCTTNTLRQTSRCTWLYNTAIDSHFSSGIVSCSNASDGFVLFVSSIGDFKTNVRNDAHNSVPFSTPRLKNMREISTAAAEAHKKALDSDRDAHPDAEFLATKFSWKSADLKQRIDVEPPALWGSHMQITFPRLWVRELGLAELAEIRLHPEMVALAAMPAAKLRAAIRYVLGS